MRSATRPLGWAAGVVVAVVVGAGLAGCSAEDVTGEPEDIGTLVHVVTEESACELAGDGGEATFHVVLENTGEDERTVTVTPRLRDAEGDESGSALERVKFTVGGDDRADGEIIVERVPDDLASCFVQLDGGEDIQIARAGGG